jgi:UDP-N-acetylmuramoylalanine--D-glutamate ligase
LCKGLTMRDWSGQTVIIVGAARQGLALARFLAQRGARVVLNDQRPVAELAPARQALADLSASGSPEAGGEVEWVCGGHPLSLLDGADLLCLSGGVPLTLPLVVEARERGIPLSNDSQIFLEIVPCKVIGITGSAGKTTTTSLVGRIAQEQVSQPRASGGYRKAWVGGNIGTPLITYVDEMSPDDLAVVELSSFQLEIMTLSPHGAAILNITPNHLDRHGTMEAYLAAKAHILEHQSKVDWAVLGRDDPGAWSLSGQARGRVLSFGLSDLPDGAEGTYLKGDTICLRSAARTGVDQDLSVMERGQIGLRGEHNLLNVMAACAIAAAAGLSAEAMRSGVKDFTGVPHRLEFIRSWGGADWYNDSIATAPERAMAAMRSFEEPLVLLAGGRDKNLPWGDFAALVRQRIDHLIVFGEAADLILKAVNIPVSGSVVPAKTGERPTVTRCGSLREAVEAAAQIVQPGDVVLLSPGGTSFDEFKDFEERGTCFVHWVRELP